VFVDIDTLRLSVTVITGLFRPAQPARVMVKFSGFASSAARFRRVQDRLRQQSNADDARCY